MSVSFLFTLSLTLLFVTDDSGQNSLVTGRDYLKVKHKGFMLLVRIIALALCDYYDLQMSLFKNN